jgi:hypothetical protein
MTARPAPTHVRPPSRLRSTPTSGVAAQTFRAFDGSTTTASTVDAGEPTAGVHAAPASLVMTRPVRNVPR